jgi:hypothetical protein
LSNPSVDPTAQAPTSQASAVLASQVPATIALPQLSLIPNISNILGNLAQTFNLTGLTAIQSVIGLFEQTKALVQSQNYTPESVNSVVAGVESLLASVGTYVPGGAFAQLEAEIAKYAAISAAIESGATTQIADVIYTSKSGQHFTCALSLSIKG